MLPAASVAVTESVWLPFERVVLSQLQLPVALTVAVQRVVAPSLTVIVLPGSAVPAIVGVLSLVVLLAGGVVTIGDAGAVVSTTNESGKLAGPLLPAASVAMAVILCAPGVKALLGEQLQLPLASAVAVQSVVAPSLTVTVPFGSAVPLMSGVVSLVLLPDNGALMTGALGAVLSMAKVRVLGVLVLPAGSVAVALRVCDPSLNGVERVQLQFPLASATAVQSVVAPSFTVTVLPGSAVPLTVGVSSVVVIPAAGVIIAGAGGALISTINGTLVGALVLPDGSVAVMLAV